MKISTILTIAVIIGVLSYLGDGEMESQQMVAEKRMAVLDKNAHAEYASGLRFNEQ